jgi:hypothetical protein
VGTIKEGPACHGAVQVRYKQEGKGACFQSKDSYISLSHPQWQVSCDSLWNPYRQNCRFLCFVLSMTLCMWLSMCMHMRLKMLTWSSRFG